MSGRTRMKIKEIDQARAEFSGLYERLVASGLDPASVAIGVFEVVAYLVAYKNVSGGGDAAYRAWLTGFESAYRQEVAIQRGQPLPASWRPEER